MENEVTDLPLMCPMCQSMSRKTLQKKIKLQYLLIETVYFPYFQFPMLNIEEAF